MIARTRTNAEAHEKQLCPPLQVLEKQPQAPGGTVVGIRDIQDSCFAIPSVLPQHELGTSGLTRGGTLVEATSNPWGIAGLSLRCKQGIDFVLALTLLLLASPFMLVIWIDICCDSKGPGIIVQERVGYKGRPFKFYKFRTMYSNCDDRVHRTYIKDWMRNRPAKNTTVFKIVNDRRVTRVGAILRRYSLDELPQLFNVLKFDMSLVGPRPALPYEVDDYATWHKQRFEGPPGLTGLWQVSGRNLLSFEDMVRLDIEYLRNWSIGLDLSLLVKTVPALLRGTGH